MSAESTEAVVYQLEAPDIQLTYRRREGTLDIVSDDHLLSKEGLEARETVEPEIGLHVTATLLDSDRSGRRHTLTLLLPEIRWGAEGGGEPAAVTGVAIVSKSFEHAVGGPPPALQSYDSVRRLEGSASPAD